MKFILFYYKTALYIAIENENVEIVKLILLNDNVRINRPYVRTYHLLIKLAFIFLITFQINNFNNI